MQKPHGVSGPKLRDRNKAKTSQIELPGRILAAWHRPRYLAESCYRFNRHVDLAAMLPRRGCQHATGFALKVVGVFCVCRWLYFGREPTIFWGSNEPRTEDLFPSGAASSPSPWSRSATVRIPSSGTDLARTDGASELAERGASEHWGDRARARILLSDSWSG